jgi:hypothetical protein
MALTSPAGCGRSVGIVRLRTKTTEFSLVYIDSSLLQAFTAFLFQRVCIHVDTHTKAQLCGLPLTLQEMTHVCNVWQNDMIKLSVGRKNDIERNWFKNRLDGGGKGKA